MAKSSSLPEGAARIMKLVERSAPNPDRPRLAHEWERQLAEVDVRSAACYASMEDLSDQLARLADELSDGVIVETADDADSLVTHVEEFERNVKLPIRPLVRAVGGDGPIKIKD